MSSRCGGDWHYLIFLQDKTEVLGRNEFPGVEGIDTSREFPTQNRCRCRNEFPGVEGIDTL